MENRISTSWKRMLSDSDLLEAQKTVNRAYLSWNAGKNNNKKSKFYKSYFLEDYKLNLETILGKKGRIENGCVIVAANMKKSRNSNSAQVRALRCRVTVFRIKKHKIFKTYELS